jgi:putative transposase
MFSRKGRSITYAMQAADLPELRTLYPWLANVPNQILQQALKNVEKAFQNFFEGRAFYPKTRGKYERDSCRFPALEQRQIMKRNGAVVLDASGEPVWKTHRIIELGEDWIDLPKIGKIRWVKHRALEGTPKSVTISRDSEFYFVSVLCEIEVDEAQAPAPEVDCEAFDYGIRQDYTMSDGTVFDVPGETPGEARHRRKLELQIGRAVEARKAQETTARAAQALAPGKRLSPSNRERRSRSELRRLDGRIARRAKDALHKFTTKLVRRAAVIGF